MWFENNEEDKNTKKMHGHSGKEKNSAVERNRRIGESAVKAVMTKVKETMKAVKIQMRKAQ